MGFVLNFDAWVSNTIASLIPHSFSTDMFFGFLSQRGLSIGIWIAIVTLLVLFEEKRDKRFIVYLIISLGISYFISVVFLKNIFQRPRPFTLLPFNTFSTSCPTDYSFPSGHATIAFAAATILSVFDKKRRWMYYLIAGLIGLSRIYLYCHYFLDVVAGGAIGSGVSTGVLHILHFRNLKKRGKSK